MRTDAGKIEMLQARLLSLAQEQKAVRETARKIARRFIISIKYKNLGIERRETLAPFKKSPHSFHSRNGLLFPKLKRSLIYAHTAFVKGAESFVIEAPLQT